MYVNTPMFIILSPSPFSLLKAKKILKPTGIGIISQYPQIKNAREIPGTN